MPSTDWQLFFLSSLLGRTGPSPTSYLEVEQVEPAAALVSEHFNPRVRRIDTGELNTTDRPIVIGVGPNILD